MACAGPTASCHAVTGLRLPSHLDIQKKIQQRKLEFFIRRSHGHCRRQWVPSVLEDGRLSGMTTANYLRTRCSHESLRAKYAVRFAIWATCILITVGHLALEKY